jgi:hypothetical protein
MLKFSLLMIVYTRHHSLIYLRSLRHYIVCLLCLLYFFCHRPLLSLIFFYELSSTANLVVDEGQPVGQCCNYLFFGLIDQYSSHLLKYLGISDREGCTLSQNFHLFEDKTVFALLLEEAVSSLQQLL